MPQVVEANGANICTAQRGLEALEQLRAVDRFPSTCKSIETAEAGMWRTFAT
jgi:hypothetical protein